MAAAIGKLIVFSATSDNSRPPILSPLSLGKLRNIILRSGRQASDCVRVAFIELLGLRRVAGLMCKFIHMQMGKRKYTRDANIFSQIQVHEENMFLI